MASGFPIAPHRIVIAAKALAMTATAICAAACVVGDAAIGSGAEKVVAVVDVTVIPMDSERSLPRHTVIVRDGLIATVGPASAVQVPGGAKRIDGTGLFLMPGLVDAHVHLRDSSELLSYLAHGVTTVVHLSGPTGNVPDVLVLRDRVERGDIMGPNILTSGRILDGDPAVFPGVSTVVRTPDEAERAVQTQLAADVDLIKVYNNLRNAQLRSVVRAAHEQSLTVWGHIPRIEGRATALQQALGAGLDVIVHGEEVFFTILHRDVETQLDQGVIPAVEQRLMREAVGLIQAHGATIIPTLSFVAMTRTQLDDLERLWTDPEARFLHPAVLSMWRQQNPTRRADLARFDLRERGKQEAVRQLIGALRDAHVPLLLGTDASAPGMFPGKSAHTELAELVAAGLTPYEALATGTVNPGRFMRQHAPQRPPFGTVTSGSRGDLVLLNANPLTDVSSAADIVGIVVRGNWYARSQIDSVRERAMEAAR